MARTARGDEVTERFPTYREPSAASHVDHFEAPARQRYAPVDAAIARMSAPAARARSSCESTRTAAICLGVVARDAAAESRKRLSSGLVPSVAPLKPAPLKPEK